MMTANAVALEDSSTTMEWKEYCDATLEDSFADNRVIVVLNNAASLSFKEYGVNDFPEVAETIIWKTMYG